MDYAITTAEGRSRLKPRRPPYWRKLGRGQHVGFRKLSTGSAGTWLAQTYDDELRKQVRKSLGAFDDAPEGVRFDKAKAAAEEWFKHIGDGGSADVLSVSECCSRYVSHLEDSGRAIAARDIAARFKRWVDGDPIGAVKLPKLNARTVEAWRKRLAAKSVVVDPHAQAPRTRPRSPSSVNRDATALRAALNFGHDRRWITSDAAWRVALRPQKNADGRRDLYLDPLQRRSLIGAAPADLAALVRGLSMVPVRPGALAALRVESFDARQQTLAIGQDKAGRDRKIKLPPNIAAFFSAQCVDKLPAAPLFGRVASAGLTAWNKDTWKKPLKAAAMAAGLPDSTVIYALRHSTITDLVIGGLDLLTIASLSGTSVAMIEKHYGHLRADVAAAALAKLYL